MNIFKKAAFIGLISMSSQLFATPGVYEINSACAQVGCFGGDDPATETIEITQRSGTFRFTSDFLVTGAEVPIKVIGNNSPNITIDFNGFRLFKFSSNAIDAIVIEGEFSRVKIKNGSIIGFLDGISVEDNGRIDVDNMYFSGMTDDAISAGIGRITNSEFRCNRYGIFALGNDVAANDAGDNLYLENNTFRCGITATDRDPVFSLGATNICKDNIIFYDADAGANTNFGACRLIGDNFCNGAPCTQGNRSAIDDVKE